MSGLEDHIKNGEGRSSSLRKLTIYRMEEATREEEMKLTERMLIIISNKNTNERIIIIGKVNI